MADKTVVIRIMATASQARSEFNAIGRDVERTGAKVQSGAVKAASGMRTVGIAAAAAGAAIVTGFAATMAVGAAAAIQFESQFVKVAKTMEGTRPQLLGVADDLDMMSRRIPVAVSELLAMAEVGGQLGISAGGIEEFTETVAQLTSATNMAANQAGTNLARFAQLMGNTESEFRQLGAVVVELGNTLPTTESEIFSMAQAIAPVAATFNTTSDSVLALSGALSASGQSAERSATSIQRIFMDMQTAIALGGRELQAFANVAGMTADEFSSLFRRDAVGALASVTEGLGRITDEGGSATKALEDLGVVEQRSIRVLLALANNNELLTESLGRANEQWREATALQDEAEKAFLTTASSFSQLGNSALSFARTLGDGLLPTIRNVNDELINLFNTASEEDFWEQASRGADQLALRIRAAWAQMSANLSITSPMGGNLETPFALVNQEDISKAQQLANSLELLRRHAVEYLTEAEEISNLPTLIDDIALQNTDVLSEMMHDLQVRYMLTSSEIVDYLKTTRDQAEQDGVNAAVLQEITNVIAEYSRKVPQLTDAVSSWDRMNKNLEPGLTFQERIMRELSEEANTLADGLNAVREATMESIGSVTDYNSAVDDLVEAYVALQTDDTIESQDALVDAFLKAEEAANALAEDGVEVYINKLQTMRDAGVITEAQMQNLTQRLYENMQAHEALNIATQGSTFTFQELHDQARLLGVTTQGLIAQLWGVNAAMAAGIRTATDYAGALLLARQAINPNIDPSILAATRRSISSEANSLAAQIADIMGGMGESIGGAIDDGIARGIGSGSAASSAAEEAGEDAAEAFISAMRANLSLADAATELADIKEVLSDLQTEYKTTFQDYWDTWHELAEARKNAMKITTEESRDLLQHELDILNTEKRIADLRKEQASLPGVIAKATEDLAKAQERYNQALIDADRLERENDANLTDAISSISELTRAYGMGTGSFADLIEAERRLAAEIAAQGEADQAKIDAEEEYADAVESAQQAIEDARFRQRQIALELAIAEKDLILAREELTQAQIDAVGPTQQVVDLEEKLQEIRERRRDIRKEVTEGERDLLEAELDLLSATLAYNEAQGELVELSPAGIQAFADLTTEVLGSGSAVGNLVPKLVDTGTAFDHLRTIASAAADSAEASAARAASAVTRAIQDAQAAASAAGSIGTSTSYTNPVSPGGAGVYIAHQGAYFPGPTSQEYLTLVRGQEMVVDSNMIAKAVAKGLGGGELGGASTVIVYLDGKEISRHVTDQVEGNVARGIRTTRRMN